MFLSAFLPFLPILLTLQSKNYTSSIVVTLGNYRCFILCSFAAQWHVVARIIVSCNFMDTDLARNPPNSEALHKCLPWHRYLSKRLKHFLCYSCLPADISWCVITRLCNMTGEAVESMLQQKADLILSTCAGIAGTCVQL